jgi:hypothetical protein
LLCGRFDPTIGVADRVAWEFDIFGDFACDLAVGDWERKAYCFVEFEDASPASIFERQGKKASKEWSKRFNHGCSQIIDWFWKLADRTKGDDFLARFGERTITYEAILVLGRDQFLDAGERVRLAWRSDNMVVNSKHIRCLPFDQLLARFDVRVRSLSLPTS